MRRITLWGLSTLTTLVLLFSYHTSTNSQGSIAAASPATTPGTTTPGTTTPGSTTPGTTTPGTTTPEPSGPSGSSVAGTYAGNTAQTRWGPVQVQITVADGKITAADVLRVPSGNHRDEEINSYAVPLLNQEATSSQSANIDTISGATVTSDGYVQSLQSAIDQAHL